jgi:alkylation response protein AidB-like acyl-CoA dehydrogenase
MDFSFTDEENKFLNEVKEFFKNNPPESFPIESHDQGNSLGAFSRAFYKKLGEAGYLSLMWPKEYGGRGESVIKQFILMEQLGYHKAPFAGWHLGQAAPREIIKHGTERAKQEVLPNIRSGDLIFWLGYSEPEAGSDLLALKTNAKEDGDYFVINGQKIWSTWAHYSDWVYLLTITDPEGKRGRNLSIFLVDKNTPGITIDPIWSLADVEMQNMIYFDNVRVHKDFLLGEKNSALNLMLAGLESDRFWSRAAKPLWLRRRLEELVSFLHHDPLGKEIISVKPWIENTLAEFRIEMEAARLFAFTCAWMLNNNINPDYESSVLKFFTEELAARYNNFVVDTLGFRGTIRKHELPFDQELCNYYLYSSAYIAAGGTTEIQKETIARRKWGLRPPSIRPVKK